MVLLGSFVASGRKALFKGLLDGVLSIALYFRLPRAALAVFFFLIRHAGAGM